MCAGFRLCFRLLIQQGVLKWDLKHSAAHDLRGDGVRGLRMVVLVSGRGWADAMHLKSHWESWESPENG